MEGHLISPKQKSANSFYGVRRQPQFRQFRISRLSSGEVIPDLATFTVLQRWLFRLFLNPTSIIGLLKNRKSPGPGNIGHLSLKFLPKNSDLLHSELLLDWTNSWKHATVICTLKARKSVHLPSSYRPISFLSFHKKIFAESVPQKAGRYIWTPSSSFSTVFVENTSATTKCEGLKST